MPELPPEEADEFGLCRIGEQYAMQNLLSFVETAKFLKQASLLDLESDAHFGRLGCSPPGGERLLWLT